MFKFLKNKKNNSVVKKVSNHYSMEGLESRLCLTAAPTIGTVIPYGSVLVGASVVETTNENNALPTGFLVEVTTPDNAVEVYSVGRVQTQTSVEPMEFATYVGTPFHYRVCETYDRTDNSPWSASFSADTVVWPPGSPTVGTGGTGGPDYVTASWDNTYNFGASTGDTGTHTVEVKYYNAGLLQSTHQTNSDPQSDDYFSLYPGQEKVILRNTVLNPWNNTTYYRAPVQSAEQTIPVPGWVEVSVTQDIAGQSPSAPHGIVKESRVGADFWSGTKYDILRDNGLTIRTIATEVTIPNIIVNGVQIGNATQGDSFDATRDQGFDTDHGTTYWAVPKAKDAAGTWVHTSPVAGTFGYAPTWWAKWGDNSDTLTVGAKEDKVVQIKLIKNAMPITGQGHITVANDSTGHITVFDSNNGSNFNYTAALNPYVHFLGNVFGNEHGISTPAPFPISIFPDGANGISNLTPLKIRWSSSAPPAGASTGGLRNNSAGVTSVTVSWTGSQTFYNESFLIYRKVAGTSGLGTLLATVANVNQYTDSTASTGSWVYSVASRYTDADGSVATSDATSTSTLVIGTPGTVGAPSSVVANGISVDSNYKNTVNIAWTNNSTYGGTQFDLYRKIGTGGSWVLVASNLSTTSYVEHDAPVGALYYSVFAHAGQTGSGGGADWSDVYSARSTTSNLANVVHTYHVMWSNLAGGGTSSATATRNTTFTRVLVAYQDGGATPYTGGMQFAATFDTTGGYTFAPGHGTSFNVTTPNNSLSLYVPNYASSCVIHFRYTDANGTTRDAGTVSLSDA